MTEDQAVELLARRLARALTDSERPLAAALARAVGYLPLAVELVGAQLADGVPWAELLADLEAEVARLESLDLPGAEDVADETTQKGLSLRASLNLSLKRLSDSRRQQFAWLGVVSEDAPITAAMTATLWETDTRTARDTLRYLYNHSLLMVGVPLPDGTPTYRLHDVVRALACRQLQALVGDLSAAHAADQALASNLPQTEVDLKSRNGYECEMWD